MGARHVAGPACEHDTRFGWEVCGVYDGVLWWSCSTCGTAWARFDAETTRGRISGEYAAAWRAGRESVSA